MSFRRFPFQVGDTSPFERFNTRSQEDRNMFYDTTPIRRSYWNDLDTTTSHFDEPSWRNPPPFRNSTSMPGSPQTRHRNTTGSSWPEGSIPIKVVHEKSSKNSSSDCSDGQASSQGSGPSVNSEQSREPRVHHIPIMVEPRGDSNSSHISNKGNEHSKTNQSNVGTENMQNSVGSKLSQGKFSTKTHLNSEESIKPTTDDTSEDASHQPRVCHIPIMVEPRVEQSSHSPDKTTTKKTSPFQSFPPRSNSSSQPFEGPSFSTRKTESAPHLSEHKTPKKPTAKQNVGPHVSKVPININEPPQMKVNQTNPAEFALNQIAKVKNEMVGLKKQVEEFTGCFQDKQYRYLDEMLTQCMLKLDNIDTGGLDEIRKARKVAINEVQTCISLLESKITRKNSKSEDPNQAITQEAMDVCKQSEEVSVKSSNNIPSEKMEPNESIDKITDNTLQNTQCSEMTEENVHSGKEKGDEISEESKVATEGKMELPGVNNKKIKVEDKTEVKGQLVKRTEAEKMEIDTTETNHTEQTMEVENANNKHSQNLLTKGPEVQTDQDSSSDISKSAETQKEFQQ
ncbi:BAG domain-containing protein Samui-like [Centruroides vittatus]|uniref:BAG domain-containing protein Samui-like n=1 Tax=Centruroides vittatus TaxID=120091 RepID=UPI00350F6D1B